MLSKLKVVLYLLFAISCSASAASDSVIVQYVISSYNGGFPFDTLKVYQSGKDEVITATLNSDTTKTSSLTPTELNNLVLLFTDNNYSALDSNFMGPCLICPVFRINYNNKRIVGNSTGGSAQLTNIKAGLDSLVAKIKKATTNISFTNNHSSVYNLSQSTRIKFNFQSASHALIVREGLPYSLSGQRIIPIRSRQ